MIIYWRAGISSKETTMRVVLVTALIVAISGSAAAGARAGSSDAKVANEARLSKSLQGLTPGKEQNCINVGPGPTRFSSEVIGDVILYKSSRRLVYRNNTAGGCERGAVGHALVSLNAGTQLCVGQIIVTRNVIGGFDSGSCALGRFVPYTPTK